jgi:hypothetical protein
MTMHGMEYLKITDAQQAGLINNYKSTKYVYKLVKTNATRSLIYEETSF